ncbi:site-specific DNA-methyltransferase [Pararhizobium sp. BT-229]|uniref:DNA-methyltransferase n=1 Tax=Pararhizobium sp. BT-229 TaxID=2986923 RepID=UPI0021F77903|nr:site-specific DNA-methyltransferase [Pararhizobium sp. BT-229]MCV9960930.1 site-specific DNA-methyltransferase [Pararhizobium sp. BT-229]
MRKMESTRSNLPSSREPGFEILCGDALEVLKSLPSGTIDMCMTSPPYWGHREYDVPGIGQEKDFKEYIENICRIAKEIQRVLKDSGSFWLNLGDSYKSKNLTGIPWRVAIALMDEQKWILRNDVVWNKIKGSPDNSKDKLRNIHEHIFHFVKQKSYYYDVDSIRITPRQSSIINGTVVSATGVSGVRYKRQIELSTSLSPSEKLNALNALNSVIEDVRAKRISDFRMVIRGQQRSTHSDREKVSGRAKELVNRGFYFLKYHPNGTKPSDVWDIIPEDTQKRDSHFAPYPADLCKIPILCTCPPGGVVLDPFCGTGTTLAVARQLGRSSIGIDISQNYVEVANSRLRKL